MPDWIMRVLQTGGPTAIHYDKAGKQWDRNMEAFSRTT